MKNLSHYYSFTGGKNLITVDKMLSHYLWNQSTPPNPSEINSEKWIRPKSEQGKSIVISTTDYMNHGAGLQNWFILFPKTF